MELRCKFKGSDNLEITYNKEVEDIFRRFGSVNDCNNFIKNEIFYLATLASNKIYPKKPDFYEHINHSGSARILNVCSSSWTNKRPTEHLDRYVKMPGHNWFEFINLLVKNLRNENLIHAASFICTDTHISLIKKRMALSTERIEIEEYKRLLYCIDELKNTPPFQKETIFFDILGVYMGQIPYINKQAKSPDGKVYDSPWESYKASCKNDKFILEQEVRIDVHLSSPYGERRDIYLLSPLLEYLKIHSPGISKPCLPCVGIKPHANVSPPKPAPTITTS